jgi:NADP-dependent 3-hydroxy acid dehydrogenase YdfG
MTSNLVGRTALVTGGSSGIGAAVAVALAEAGASVAVAARRAGRLQQVVARIEAGGGIATSIQADVTDEDSASQVVEECVQQLGRLDILVNAAGVIASGTVENADLAEWRRVMDVNLMATLYTCRAAIPHIKANGGGDIVNISSTSVRRTPSGMFGPYSSSKAAVAFLTEGMRQELGKSDIRVCNFMPGATETQVAEGISDPSLRAVVRGHVHSERAMKPNDVASAIVFIVGLPPRVNVAEILLFPTGEPV